ncbi:homeobox protein pnx-like [Plodia interpunctella]|uniref:homeobox protein pnx-like n=1 Tax=Plodia interpunctella TaxID=58824 RepID=UPI0023680263|nr:homeobox protein pnx-like [Plodia interpunctella]
MFQNMLMTALTPLGITNEVQQWQNMPFTTVWPEQNIKEEITEVPVIRKKPKRMRTAYTTEQLKVLEKTYNRFKYIDVNHRRELAATLNIGEKSIKVWFQNRRMKEKRTSSESSCDSSSEISREMSPPHVETHKPAFDYSNAHNTDNLEPRYEFPVYHVQAYPEQFYGQSKAPITHYPENYQNVKPTTDQTESFVKEGGVYPTQYYPTSVDYNNSEGNYGYNNNDVTSSNYWSPNGFDLSYFQPNY